MMASDSTSAARVNSHPCVTYLRMGEGGNDETEWPTWTDGVRYIWRSRGLNL